MRQVQLPIALETHPGKQAYLVKPTAKKTLFL